MPNGRLATWGGKRPLTIPATKAKIFVPSGSLFLMMKDAAMRHAALVRVSVGNR